MTRKSWGYYNDFEVVRAEIQEWMDAHEGAFPTQGELKTANRGALHRAINRHGGYPVVREKMGVPRIWGKTTWDSFERVQEALEAYEVAHGKFPTKPDLVAGGLADLDVAIGKKHGGYLAVRERIGKEKRIGYGYWNDLTNVRSAIKNFIEEHGRFPTQSDLAAVGLKGLVHALWKKHDGLAAIRREMGYDEVTEELLTKHAAEIASKYMATADAESTFDDYLASVRRSCQTERELLAFLGIALEDPN